MVKRILYISLAVVIAIGLAACGSSNVDVPKCKPRAQHCKQASNGQWIPYVYWYLLFRQQHLTAGQTPKYQSSLPESSVPHAVRQQAQEQVPESERVTPPHESSPVEHISEPSEPHISVHVSEP